MEISNNFKLSRFITKKQRNNPVISITWNEIKKPFADISVLLT